MQGLSVRHRITPSRRRKKKTTIISSNKRILIDLDLQEFYRPFKDLLQLLWILLSELMID